MKFPKISNLLGLFGKKSQGSEPSVVPSASETSIKPANAGVFLLPAPRAPEDSASSASGATLDSGAPGPDTGPPFLIFLDEMGYYLPSGTLSSHMVSIGTSAKGKSSFSAMLEAREREATKVVLVTGDAKPLAEWSALADPETITSWKAWLPLLQEACLDEEDELCVQALLKCPLTCAELYEALSSQYPALVITVNWYNPAPVTL